MYIEGYTILTHSLISSTFKYNISLYIISIYNMKIDYRFVTYFPFESINVT